MPVALLGQQDRCMHANSLHFLASSLPLHLQVMLQHYQQPGHIHMVLPCGVGTSMLPALVRLALTAS